MEIRPPETRTEARQVAVAHNRAWREAYDGLLPDDVLSEFEVDPDEETVDAWHDRLQSEEEPTLVADVDGSVVGYAVFRWDDTKSFVDANEAGLKEIYVHPDHWGTGVGTALLEAGVDRLPADATALKLEVFADNEVGRGFYESRRFDRVDTTQVEVADDTYRAAVYERGL